MADTPNPIRQADIDAYLTNLEESVQGRADKLPYGTNPIGGYTDSGYYDAGLLFSIGTVTEVIPEWSIWTLGRDIALRRFFKTEPIAAGAVYSMTARLKALEYQLSGGDEKHDAIDAMFRQADLGNGFRTLISKTVTDLSCLAGHSTVALGGDRRGKFKRIQDIVNEKDAGPVLTVDSNGDIVERKIIEWHISPLATRHWVWLSLELTSGHSGQKRGGLWLTNDHPVLTESGWLASGDVQNGMKIATRHVKPNGKQQQLLAGMLLGDAGLKRLTNATMVRLSHSIEQIEWFDLKRHALKGFDWTGENEYTSKLGSVFVGANTNVSAGLNDLHNAWYPNGKKLIPRQLLVQSFSPLMLAAWYMDDGHIQHNKTKKGIETRPSAYLATHSFSQSDCEWLADLLTSNGYISKVYPSKKGTKTYFRIYIGAQGAEKFFNDIAPYVPNSMRYKLPDNQAEYRSELWDIGNAEIFYDTVVCADHKPLKTGYTGIVQSTYHIGVDETRNFIANNMVVHNTQDNGAFWELTGAGNPESELVGGVVTGFNHLDALQCYRTFDPEYPVVYIDPTNGKRHKLHRTRVHMMSSMPQTNELARNIGFCPLSRALLSVQLMKAFQTYRYEKASGKFDRAIGYGTGMTMATLKKLLQNADLSDEGEGFVRFGRIPFFVSPRDNVTLDVLDLASIPDGFDLKTETEIYVYSLALAFGVDAREFWPATQTGATKGDASIQNMKARGKGLADLITTIEDAIQNRIIPADVDFAFDFVDDEHDAEMAQTDKVRVDTIIAMKKEGIINDVQAQAILIHEGVLDEKVLLDAEQMVIPYEGDSLDESPEEPLLNNPQLAMPEITTDFSGEDVEEDASEAEKAVKTLAQYRSALRATALSLWEYYSRPIGAVMEFDSVIRRHLTEAAYAGLKQAGLLVGDLETSELNEIQLIIFNEQMYVQDLVQFIIGERELKGTIEGVYNRLDLWASRYQMVKDKFMLMGMKNAKQKWVRTKTDSCIDCITYDQRVYRANIWLKYEIVPKMYDLTCRGGHCGCSFEKTDDPVDKGAPPRPRGRAKSLEVNHSHD